MEVVVPIQEIMVLNPQILEMDVILEYIQIRVTVLIHGIGHVWELMEEQPRHVRRTVLSTAHVMHLQETIHLNQLIHQMGVQREHTMILLLTLRCSGIGPVVEVIPEVHPVVMQNVLLQVYVNLMEEVILLNPVSIRQMDVLSEYSRKIVIFQLHGSGHVSE
jgi:hypothetical protein